MTPTHKPEDCANPKRGDSTGDSILFSAILYYSGEKWAARNIYESMDEQGGMWRSPQRRRSRCDGSWGRSRFSQDAMLGVLLFLVTEYNNGHRQQARNFAHRWGKWMKNHLSQREFSLCRWDWTDFEAMDACALEGTITEHWFGTRGAMIRRVFDYIGAPSPARQKFPFGMYRLGDGGKASDYLKYLEFLWRTSDVTGKKMFHYHLACVASLIFQEMGEDRRIDLSPNFRQNPFALWIKNGQQSNNNIRERAYVICSEANDHHRKGDSKHDQWTWQRPDREKAWRNSYGWDCVVMLNLLLMYRFPSQNLGPEIASQREIHENSFLRSKNGRFTLHMQGDGNLVVYTKSQNGFKPKWASNTSGKGNRPFKVVMQSDGNLVIYDRGGIPTWATSTSGKGKGPYILSMQDDGNLVIYDSFPRAIWDLGTRQ